MRRYIKLHTQILANDKVAALSSDAARWHYAKLLLHGKMTEPEGRWRSMALLRSSVGEDTFAHVPEFMATEPEGLLVEAASGELVIRQWWLWQGSDRKARQSEQSGRSQEKNRLKWAANKRHQRAKAKAAAQAALQGNVHPMSTNVHPNRETLLEDVDRTSAGAPVPSTDMSEQCGDCGKTFTDAAPATWLDSQQGYKLHSHCRYELGGAIGLRRLPADPPADGLPF